MNWIDFLVVRIVVVLIGLVIFFRYIYPRIKKKGPSRRAKRLVKDYHRSEDKK